MGRLCRVLQHPTCELILFVCLNHSLYCRAKIGTGSDHDDMEPIGPMTFRKSIDKIHFRDLEAAPCGQKKMIATYMQGCVHFRNDAQLLLSYVLPYVDNFKKFAARCNARALIMFTGCHSQSRRLDAKYPQQCREKQTEVRADQLRNLFFVPCLTGVVCIPHTVQQHCAQRLASGRGVFGLYGLIQGRSDKRRIPLHVGRERRQGGRHSQCNRFVSPPA